MPRIQSLSRNKINISTERISKGENSMQLFKMNPVFKDYLWGGNKLKDIYKKASPYSITAESWEIASHKNGESTVCGGEHDGKTIKQLTEIYKEKLLGDRIYKDNDTKFPLLIKLIDAKDNLSVQVHPNDSYANEVENGELGKTEMWYVMEAEHGAKLIYGFKKDISKQEFEDAIKNNTLLDYVNFVECKKGDCFFIPSGMLHAIGKGLLIAEIQQNSDTTYRVYDYNRKDANGNTRELHVNKAIDVTNLSSSSGNEYAVENNGVLVKCDYFTTEKITLNGEMSYTVDKERFETLIICDGSAVINNTIYNKGDSVLVPAYAGKITLCGNAVILKSYL